MLHRQRIETLQIFASFPDRFIMYVIVAYVIGPSSSTVLIWLPASFLGQTHYTVRRLSHYLEANSLALFMFTNFLQTPPPNTQPCRELLAASSMWASIRKGEE